MSQRGPPDISGTHSLLVLNISFRTRADQLRHEFARFGDLADVYIPRDRETGESRGFAFVRYYKLEDAEEARKHMDRVMLDHREIGVQLARYGRQPFGYSAQRGGPRRRPRSRSPYRGRGRGSPRAEDRYYRRSPPRRTFDDFNDNRRPPRNHSPDRKRFRVDDTARRTSPNDSRHPTRRSPPRTYDERRYPSPNGEQRRVRSPRSDSPGHDNLRRESPGREHLRRDSPRRDSPSRVNTSPVQNGNGYRVDRSPVRDRSPMRDRAFVGKRSPVRGVVDDGYGHRD